MSRGTDRETRTAVVITNGDSNRRNTTTELLGEVGLEPSVYNSAEAALAAMDTSRIPQLIITDLHLPRLDGLRLCRLLRSPEFQPLNRVPLAVISDTLSHDDAAPMIADGLFDAVITTPIDRDRYLKLLRALLDHEKIHGALQVLVVKTSHFEAGRLLSHLGDQGWNAEMAGDSAAAAQHLSATNYDLLIVDENLPNDGCAELLELARDQNPACAPVVLTNNPAPERALEAMRAGAAAYLREPLEPESLIEQCRRVHAEHTLLRREELLHQQTQRAGQAEEKYDCLVEGSLQGIVIASDSPVRIVFANTTIAEMTERSVEELLTMKPAQIAELVHPDDRERFFDNFRRRLAGKAPRRQAEYRIIRSDGSTAWVLSHSTRIEHDAKPATLTVFIDITDRKKVEEALRRSQTLLNDTERLSRIGGWEWDIDSETMTWTDECYRLHGFKKADLDTLSTELAHQSIACYDPACREKVAEAFQRCIAEGTSYDLECGFTAVDGTRRRVRTIGHPVYEGGRVVRVRGNFSDISREREVADQLRLQGLVLDQIADHVTVTDLDGNVTWVNQTHKKSAGQETTDDHQTSPAWGENRKKILERTLSAGSWRGEVVNLLSDGREVVQDLRTQVVRDEEGAPFGIVGIATDITERKSIEQSLRESENKWRNVLVQTPQIGIALDPKARIIFTNNHFLELTGWTEEEVMGKDWFDLCIPEDVRAEVRRVFDTVIRTKSTETLSTFENDILTSSGERRHVSWANVPTLDMTGEIEDVTCLGIDLTEREWLEHLLIEGDRRWRQAQAVAKIGNWEFDVDSQRIWASEEAFRIFGIPHDKDLTGAHQLSLEEVEARIPERDRVHQALFDLLTEDRTYDLEYEVARPDSEEGRIVRSVAQVDRSLDGTPRKVTGTIQDITARRRLEDEREKLQQQLAQSQKMEAIGRLAGGVAHDFNNVLCAIGGNAALALDEIDDTNPLRKQLEEIEKASDRAADLTRQLLAFSRKQVVEPRVVNLSHLIEGLHGMLTRLLGEDIVLRTLAQKRLDRVRVDPGQLEQVVMNLAINARDAMPDGGELLIETANVTLDEAYCSKHAGCHPGAHVMLAVSDTGAGMDEETRARVFEPFFTTKKLGKGTGLGLATVHGIVEQSNGRIEVYSEPGQGTSFKIYFPRVLDAADPLPATRETTPVGGGETVLIVEDEPMVRGVAADILELKGYRVLTAGSGREALNLVRGHDGPLDLLITDVVMPAMNGRELAEQLTALRPDIKVLFTSGYTQNVIVHHGVLDEGLRFLPKPYTVHDLSEQVRRLLDEAP